MDCQQVEFSPQQSAARIARASRVFPAKILYRLLAFALYLLGAKRKMIATMTGIPEGSLKTAYRLLFRDGLPALQDRRRAAVPPVAAPTTPARFSVRRDGEWHVVAAGAAGELRIPCAHKVQARTVLLSLLNSGLLSVREAASLLQLSESHCRELATKLARADVDESLIDKRLGQTHDYLVGPEQKAEIIRQFAARTVTGLPTSSDALAELVNAQAETRLAPRTIRWHMRKLGLAGIRKSLPELVETLKKNADHPA